MRFYKVWFAKLGIFYKTKLIKFDFLQYFHIFLSLCSNLEKVTTKDIGAWCEIQFGNEKANPLFYAGHLFNDKDLEIKDVIIPNSITHIGSYAFYGYSLLKSIVIPNTVTSIGGYAFYKCI